jgi:hypothetical protein
LFPPPLPLPASSHRSDQALGHLPGTKVTIAQHSMAVLAEMDSRIVDVDKAAAIADLWHPVATDHAEPVPGSPEPPD